MKAATTALINYLRTSDKFILVELYTFGLVTGEVIRWTNGSTAITSGGYTYSSLGPLITRGRTKIAAKLEVPTLEITLQGAVLLGSTPIGQAAVNGVFDGATVKVVKVVMPTYGDTSLGEVEVFTGRVSMVTPSHTEVRLSAKHEIELLNTQWPRNLIQPGCPNQLFDAGCRLQRSAYQQTATATGGDRYSIVAALGKPAGWFDLGKIVFISGALSGLSRTVKSYDGSTIVPSYPLPGSPVGCQFQIWPGCDGAQSTCSTKFSNLANFRGTPYVPKPEAVR